MVIICQIPHSYVTLSPDLKTDTAMKIIRYQTSHRKAGYGWLLEDKVGPIMGDIFGAYQRGEARTSLDKVQLLSPVAPSKIICVARNFPAHAAEHGAAVPEVPVLFFKPPSAVIGPGEPILIPPQAERVEHEAELAVVIGKGGRWIDPSQAKDHILGYTIANDVTERVFQRNDLLWTRPKGLIPLLPSAPGSRLSSTPLMRSFPAGSTGTCAR